MHQPLHIHFGAGRIGVGVVLELLKNPQSLVVMQRVSNDFRRLRSQSLVRVGNSHGFALVMRVIYDDQNQIDPATELSRWDRKQPLLICSPDFGKFDKLLADATSMSMAMKEGQEDLRPLLENTRFTNNIVIFPFENEYALGNLRNKKITHAKVIVDRICTNRLISMKEIKVLCEQFLEVVIYSTRKQIVEETFKQDMKRVIIAESQEEFDFYHQRKRLLMNGVHFVLAIYGYARLAEMGVPAKEWRLQYLPLLQEVITAPHSEFAAHIANIIDLQIIRILRQTPRHVLRKIYKNNDQEQWFYELREYCQRVLKRVRSNIDVLERIFDFGNREASLTKYKRFIAAPRQFVLSSGPEIDAMSIRERPLSVELGYTFAHLYDHVANSFLSKTSEGRFTRKTQK